MLFFVAVNEPATPSINSSASKILSPSLASEIESLSLANDVPTVIAPVSYHMPFDINYLDILTSGIWGFNLHELCAKIMTVYIPSSRKNINDKMWCIVNEISRTKCFVLIWSIATQSVAY